MNKLQHEEEDSMTCADEERLTSFGVPAQVGKVMLADAMVSTRVSGEEDDEELGLRWQIGKLIGTRLVERRG